MIRESARKFSPRTEMTDQARGLVGPANRISFADARRLPVFATSWLVVHLEYAARDAIALGLKAQE